MPAFNGQFTHQDQSGFSGPGGKIMHPFQKVQIDSCGVKKVSGNLSYALYGEYSCATPPELVMVSSTKYNYNPDAAITNGGQVFPVSARYADNNHATWALHHLVFVQRVGSPSEIVTSWSSQTQAVTNYLEQEFRAWRPLVMTFTQVRGDTWRGTRTETRPGGLEIERVCFVTVSYSAMNGKCSDLIGGFFHLSVTESVTYCTSETNFKPVTLNLGSATSKFGMSDIVVEDDISSAFSKLTPYFTGFLNSLEEGLIQSIPNFTAPFTL